MGTDAGNPREIQGNERPNYVKVYEYRLDEKDESLATNQMALVFPPPRSDAEVYRRLTKSRKKRPDGFSSWSIEERLELLEYLDEFHHVFQDQLVILHKVVAVIRKSFSSRNPANPRVYNALVRIMAGQEVKLPRLSEAGGGGGLGIILSGITGVGKTSFIDRVKAYIGDYGRFHQSLNGEPAQWPQLGVICVAAQKTWALTQKRILAEADRQFGRDYYLKREHSATGPRLVAAVHGALTSGFAPLLIIDEMQRLARLNPTAALEILQGLIDMMGEFGVPVLLVGTVRVRVLLELFPAEMDKFTNGGMFEMLPLNEADPDAHDFVETLKEQSVSLTPIVYPVDFVKMLVLYSMGVKRIMREYMKVIFTRHANDESVVVDGALMRDISLKELARFQKSLSVLRKAKLGMRLSFSDLQAYEDYLPPDTSKKSQSRAEVLTEAQWRSANHTSIIDDNSPDIDVDEFLQLEARLVETMAQHELNDTVKAGEQIATKAEAKKTGTARTGQPASKRKQRAKEQVAKVAKVVPLGQYFKEPGPRLDGIDPSDIR